MIIPYIILFYPHYMVDLSYNGDMNLFYPRVKLLIEWALNVSNTFFAP